ncbi:MAG: TIGR03087 family PEP-CTERM/XrtA system glycosyltransferase [Azonexus sp.]|jgi:sugar transferase (PEP-CTERM/EpsH1 system associated)|nr:TIGR03087 family PEP-CTERM/XrtA system glycosyltransferase [Azonexus sp.]
MANVLYLVHRLPYPPNKGDKVRSFNLLRHLLRKHRVFLGTFLDDRKDRKYVRLLRAKCAELHVAKLNPRWARLRSVKGLLTGQPLTLPYYHDAGLQQWVDDICRREQIDAIVVFSSAMVQYVENKRRQPLLIDFVDVDSAKWTQYATQHRWPMSWIYGREGRLLLDYERRMAARAARSFLVTEAEVELFRQLAPECSVRVEAMCNGVDTHFFAPAAKHRSPFAGDGETVVFTGAMDYWPNIDAVTWFVKDMLPTLRRQRPRLRFYIVGRNPTPEVTALAGKNVVVTGTVHDIRPYLQHADVVVAPLRVARGIQNKILEAMAMARPVVAAADCAAPVDATPGKELIVAGDANEFVTVISDLLDDPETAAAIGKAARQRVIDRYSWKAHMRQVDPYLVTAISQ